MNLNFNIINLTQIMTTLANQLKKYKKIHSVEIWNENNKTWFILKYEWPKYYQGFVLQSNKVLGSLNPTLIQIGKKNDLIDSLCKLCDSPSKLNLNVQDDIIEHPVYKDRKHSIRRKTPLKINGWDCILEPTHNKHFAITSFQYDKIN